MPLQADQTRLASMRRRLDELKTDTPASLAPVLARLSHALVEIGQQGAPDRVRARAFEGPGGSWKVSRFSAHGNPWVGLEWPASTSRALTGWMNSQLRDEDLATTRPDVPANQLWFYCGGR